MSATGRYALGLRKSVKLRSHHVEVVLPIILHDARQNRSYRSPEPNRLGITGCGGGSVGAVRGMAIPVMDRNGLSLSLEDFSQRCVDCAMYLKNHRINGQRTFPVTLQTHTLHCLGAHLWRTSIDGGTCGSINASASNVWLPNSPKRYLLGTAAGKEVPSWLAGYD